MYALPAVKSCGGDHRLKRIAPHHPAPVLPDDPIRVLLQRWRDDAGGTYRTWFLWEERIKNFRSIRRGLHDVVAEIEAGTFGNTYRGSSLETVVHSIAEQRQLFKGADHAWLWKPKLRIPDIYESPDNQRAFGRFLNICMCCQTEEQVLGAIRRLDEQRIKGLGPTAANLLYFLHPTIAPPFNTAIVNGYNILTGANVKLGRWDGYLAMRRGLLAMNTQYRELLSNDLGALAGFVFDVGKGRYPAPPPAEDAAARAAWAADLELVREESVQDQRLRKAAQEGDCTHTEVQAWLRDLGHALSFDVWIASNDRARPWLDGRLGDGCLDRLPVGLAAAPGAEAVRLIDVLWLHRAGDSALSTRVAAAFEVEHTTSIYSGIVRLLDLALGAPEQAVAELFLVAPDARENDVRAQLSRPAFSRVADLRVRFLAYGDLAQHRESMARFGTGLKSVEAIARSLS